MCKYIHYEYWCGCVEDFWICCEKENQCHQPAVTTAEQIDKYCDECLAHVDNDYGFLFSRDSQETQGSNEETF